MGFSARKALETLRLSEVTAGKSVGGPEVVPGLNPRKLQHPGAMRTPNKAAEVGGRKTRTGRNPKWCSLWGKTSLF